MKALPALALAGRSLLLFLALAAGSSTARAADANPPDRLTYQGFLADANGNPLATNAPVNYDVVFRIWKDSSSTAPADRLWTEQQTVTVDKGYFTVLLGEGANIGENRPNLSTLFASPNASDRYVEMTVKAIGPGSPPADVTIKPRLRLLTVPYAFLAKQASQLVNNAGSAVISSSGNAVTINGSLAATSFAGSGAALTGLTATNITGTIPADRLRLNNQTLYFRHGTDTGHGVGFFGTDTVNTKFANVNVDGPVLFGYSGGALGTRQGTAERIYLQWTNDAVVVPTFFYASLLGGNGSLLTDLNASKITSGTLTLPSGGLFLDGTTSVSGISGQGLLHVGSRSSEHVAIDRNDIQKYNNDDPNSPLYINYYGGDVSLANETGNVRAGGKQVTVGEEKLRIVRGIVNASGSGAPSIDKGTGYSVARTGTATGRFTLTFSPAFSDTPAVTVTADTDGDYSTSVKDVTKSTCNVKVYDVGGNYKNSYFHFIAIGPR